VASPNPSAPQSNSPASVSGFGRFFSKLLGAPPADAATPQAPGAPPAVVTTTDVSSLLNDNFPLPPAEDEAQQYAVIEWAARSSGAMLPRTLYAK
jgi:hypothetical protein